MSLAGISPMSIIEPPPATGGTLPGLVQYLNNWLLGNDYQACTALTSDCLTNSRANFDSSYLSLILNLIQSPNALGLTGMRQAHPLPLLGTGHPDSYITLGDHNDLGTTPTPTDTHISPAHTPNNTDDQK